jgi:hypothetical protein
MQYKPEYAKIARRVVERRAPSDEDLAYIFGVDKTTFMRWNVEHPELASALHATKLAQVCRARELLIPFVAGLSGLAD